MPTWGDVGGPVVTFSAASNAAVQQDAATTRSGSFDHRVAWIFGTVAYGVAIVMAGVGGSIALRLAPGDLRLVPDGEVSADALAPEHLGASGIVGLVALGLAVALFALSLATRQHPKVLPAWLRRVIRRAHLAVRRVGSRVVAVFDERFEAAEVRLDRRGVLAVLDALALGAPDALLLRVDVGHGNGREAR